MAYEDRIVKDNMHKRLVGREKGTMLEISEPLTFTQLDSGDVEQGHALFVRVVGNTIVESLNDNDVSGGVLTFSAVPEYVRIFNTGESDLTFTINGLEVFVPAGAGLETGIDTTNGSVDVSVSGTSEFYFQRLV